MGTMNLIPIVSKGFNFYFPMLICLLCVGTYFRFGSRCLHIFGIRQFFDDDQISAEYIEDGRNLMKRGRSLLPRIDRDTPFVVVLERRNFGGIDELPNNTSTAAQRRDRRKELEEKYGLRSLSRETAANDVHSDSETRQLKTSSSLEEPLLTNSVDPPALPRRLVVAAAPPTNIFNDV